uniref:Uncharacterized protein n=1 Tax=Arundo donax TaxID=35708 RepID=A0A0A9F314_ARUDO
MFLYSTVSTLKPAFKRKSLLS